MEFGLDPAQALQLLRLFGHFGRTLPADRPEAAQKLLKDLQIAHLN
jgi:hypothetical protein